VSAPRHLEYVHLRVEDLGRALEYFDGLMGLIELGRDGGLVYLGAGLDDNIDLVLEAGGTGVVRFGLRIDSDAIEPYAQRVSDAGVALERGDGRLPGHDASLRLEGPGGIGIELCTVADRRYLEPYRPAHARTRGMGLLDVDHVTVSHEDPAAYAQFLADVLGLRCSDAIRPPAGPWLAAWMRIGTCHHDVAVMLAGGPGQTLHHLAWTCESIDHLKSCCDRLADAGLPLEAGIGRHPAGSNLFVYYRDPSGNRTELSAEMAHLDPDTPPRYWSKPSDTFDAWREYELADSFRQGS
jgi:catechol 2,3-dioxygenase